MTCLPPVALFFFFLVFLSFFLFLFLVEVHQRLRNGETSIFLHSFIRLFSTFFLSFLFFSLLLLLSFFSPFFSPPQIDKAAMDALVVDEGSVWEPRMEVRQDVEGFLGGVTACLKRGGIFMQITFHQPHFRRRYFLNDFSSSPFSPPPSSLTRKRIRLASQKREEEGDQPRNSSKEKEDEKKKKEEMTSEKGINLVNETKDKEEEELEWILPESFPYREAISSSTPVYWSERYSWEFFSCELKKKTQEEEEGGGGGGCFHNFLFIARKL
ncbi:s-adenosyl-l-methionine-dependent methyltransferase [Cystoisospora suis]|uniref:S-adenosyl-l-methionine-dependent methyltransferase n=1 Tax=Cystoisospora suis TaxID=483139 RepID=A0A2C6L3L5_9APIC|nr:s-adenosyl-l-methionine-dependent methyltransferase [Cystoisospora suis]